MVSIRWQVLPGLMTAVRRRIVEVLWRFHGGRPNLGAAGQVDQAWDAFALFSGTRSEPGLQIARTPIVLMSEGISLDARTCPGIPVRHFTSSPHAAVS